jgi:hypothetical protein
MAMQQTGTPPKTKRLGIFPHSVRKFVIIFSITLFLLTGIIGTVGIWQNWGIVYNLIFLLLAVASVIIGILTLWPTTSPNETSTPISSEHHEPNPVQVNIYNNAGQSTDLQRVPSSNNESPGQNPLPNRNAINTQQPSKNMPANNSPVSPTPAPSLPMPGDVSPRLNRDDLLEALSSCLEAVFVRVVAFSHVPSGILSGYDKPQAIRADELIRWAESEGDQSFYKLDEAIQRAKYGKKKA